MAPTVTEMCLALNELQVKHLMWSVVLPSLREMGVSEEEILAKEAAFNLVINHRIREIQRASLSLRCPYLTEDELNIACPLA